MTRRVHIQEQRLKPVGTDGIEKIRKIVKEGAAKVNEVLVDAFSASTIIAIYDAVNPANQEKLRSFPVARVADVSFKLLNKHGRAA